MKTFVHGFTKSCTLVTVRHPNTKQEAEFRFMVGIAEYCEDSGLDKRISVKFSKRKSTRYHDKMLYFFGFDDAGVHVEPQGNMIEKVYAAYATLAEIHFEFANETENSLRQEHEDEHGEPIESPKRQRLVDHRKKQLGDAKSCLEAYLSFREVVSRWYGDKEVQQRYGELEHMAKGERLRPLQRMPDKDEILAASKLLLYTLKWRQHALADRLWRIGEQWIDLSIHTFIRNGIEGWHTAYTTKRLVHRNKALALAEENAGQATSSHTTMHTLESTLWEELEEKLPDLLRVETVGGWVGYSKSHTHLVKQIFYLLQILASTAAYYVDFGLDVYVAFRFFEQREYSFAFTMLAFMGFGVVMACAMDRATTESSGESKEQSGWDEKRWRTRALPFWVRCVLNLSHTRMLHEMVMAISAWRRGNKPRGNQPSPPAHSAPAPAPAPAPAASAPVPAPAPASNPAPFADCGFDQIRAAEGLFESVPQSTIQAYALVHAYYYGQTLDFYIFLSVVSSTVAAAGTLAMLGQNVCFTTADDSSSRL
eukprot:SAG11_NODE_1843_length_4179_cov_2.361520_2_plen_537_part_00